MGTRGLHVVLYRGRYFVYYQQYDTYPEGLGQSLVQSIPCEPEQYKEWLRGQREWYAARINDLESTSLTVTENQLHELLAAAADAREDDARPCYPEPRWTKVDALEELPTAFCKITNDLYIEWVYVIDLDRELFSINNWIFFDLWNISKRWIDAIEFSDDGGMVFSFETAPEGFEHVEPVGYFDGLEKERDRYGALGEQYQYLMTKAETNFKLPFPETPHQIISLVLFEEFIRKYTFSLHLPFPGGVFNSFGFKEMAYAILSFATCQFYLDRPDDFCGKTDTHQSTGYLAARDDEGTPKIMPLFGSGCHMHDQEPGSAPAQCIYWFQNVLVSIVPDPTLRDDTNAVIAKAVEYGRTQDRSNFEVVLFSIFSAVFLQVHIDGATTQVRRTEVVRVLDSTKNDDEEDQSCGEDTNEQQLTSTPLAKLHSRTQGFVSLRNFFAKSAALNLMGFDQGALPLDLYANIIGHVDPSTRQSCAQASPGLNGLLYNNCTLGKDLRLVDFTPRTAAPKKPRKRPDPAELGDFTIRSDAMRKTYRTALTVCGGRGPHWSPVIGSESRPSMITKVALQF